MILFVGGSRLISSSRVAPSRFAFRSVALDAFRQGLRSTSKRPLSPEPPTASRVFTPHTQPYGLRARKSISLTSEAQVGHSRHARSVGQGDDRYGRECGDRQGDCQGVLLWH